MHLKNGTNIPIKEKKIESVNVIIPRLDNLTHNQRFELNRLLKNYPTLFAEPDDKLTYLTNVKAEIRINTDTPVYSRFYQYPMALKAEVDKQVKDLRVPHIIHLCGSFQKNRMLPT